MKQETPIYAARGGIVKKVKEDFEELPKELKKVYKGKTNSIAIHHNDGTRAIYLHLSEDGVVVNEGDYVKKGQLIAYSGNTGKSSGPHLHFVVLKKEPGQKPSSIPVKFKTQEAGNTYLERGQRYSNLSY